MASLQSITKAQGVGLLLKKLTGIDPVYEYGPDYVRIYYHPDKLKLVQKALEKVSASGPGDVRVDWFPMVVPMAIKKAIPFAAGLLLIGYLIGGRK
jgi:hypothetical protein